ncbi:unnamed protein product [Jaminaea pallidilutea]
MSGYRPTGRGSPTEESYQNLRAPSSLGDHTSSRPNSGLYQLGANWNGSTAQARSSVLSQHVLPSGSHHSTQEGELGPYSALRTRGATSSHSSGSLQGNGKSGSGAGDERPVVALWGEKEADDYLHEGDADKRSYAPSWRGIANVATLILLALGILMLFAGYPIIANLDKLFNKSSTNGGYNLGGSNGSGQVPQFQSLASLVDSDTKPADRSWTHPVTNDKYHIVFSDEFEQEGRTFWPGDDPFWEAVDLWYGGTGDFEWYTPEQVNTTNGALQITMEEKPTHNLNFASGMIQSWNQFCFQGGYIEYSIMQPGTPQTTGYWPAAWLMGNLGRAGYLASTDGMWPYSYQGCDTGIMPGQMYANESGPEEAIDSTATYADNGRLSHLPGMRTPACTCSGEDHPGPNNRVGRSAPEIDCLEAQIQSHQGERHSYSSQSLQTAPFDVQYYWKNSSDYATIYDDDVTEINTYVGGPLQEAVSSVSLNPDRGFQDTQGEFVTYGIEYEPDWNNDGGGSVTWFIDGKPTWTVKGTAVGPVPELDVSQRTVPTEPMYIIMNLGMSRGFQPVEFTGENAITFPAIMRIDYVRVYQKDGQDDRISCDPKDHPTADYIKNHPDIYANANLTTYNQTSYGRPKNSFRDGC